MKQYLDQQQTAKLIELGFEKPKGIEFLVREEDNSDNAKIVQRIAYSIGELLSFLPPKIWDDYAQIYWELCIDWDIIGNVWRVVYFHKALMRCYRNELIDALFDMILRLKEEGVI